MTDPAEIGLSLRATCRSRRRLQVNRLAELGMIAAAAIAGAVLRPSDSRMNPKGMGISPVSRYSSAVLKNRSRLVTVRTSTTFGKPLARKNDFCSKLWPSAKRIKGLGCCSRDTGHKRVPAPPERITGINCMVNRQN